jgi:ribosomal protein S18 acetylase RimI-like enzyme
MNCSLRVATIDDFDGICEVFEEADVLHCQALSHIFRRTEKPVRSKAYIYECMTGGNSAFWVAEGGNRIVGVLHIAIEETPDLPILVPRRYGKIHDLVVRQDYRRLGIGRSLMKKANRWAMEKGVTQVELTVWEFNEGAIAFYEELGYSTASRKMCIRLKENAD